MNKNTVVILILVLLSLFGLYSYSWAKDREGRLWIYRDADLMEQEIERLIPLDSSIERAKEIMEISGFECRYAEDSSFFRDRSSSSSTGKKGESIRYKGIDALHCELSRFLPLPTRLQALIAHEENKVTIIAVSAHVTIVD